MAAEKDSMMVLSDDYRKVRKFSEALCKGLSAEDCQAQSMPDASPVKWHLAHTSWFFETFILEQSTNYRPYNPEFRSLYNSYYETVGPQYSRPQRGLITRPDLEEVYRYRAWVDERIIETLENLGGDAVAGDTLRILEIGLNHEQQHQELILTDIKHLLSMNPTDPVFRSLDSAAAVPSPPQSGWCEFESGRYSIGASDDGFSFDNERPRHEVLLQPFALAQTLVTNREYIEFIEDAGYRRPELWLSEGWATVQNLDWRNPLYWHQEGGGWSIFGLGGRRSVAPDEPVCHVSFFEADAFARWRGCRLATEFEWEIASREAPHKGNLLDAGHFHPRVATGTLSPTHCEQMFGDVWEWTSSPYVAYPRYTPPDGALGEYNGKFMCNQMVLRGGSCATPASHIRETYRNFFPAETRWQFSGLRLARDL